MSVVRKNRAIAGPRPDAGARPGMWWAGTIVLTALTLYLFHLWGRPYLNVEHEGTVQIRPADIPRVAATVSQERLAQTVTKLASFGSRLTGSPGADEAADYLRAEMQGIVGAGNVREEKFDIDNPFDLGCEMLVGGEEAGWFRVHPMWAPVVSTYRLAGERSLGTLARVRLEDLLRGRRNLEGAAAVLTWPTPADLREMLFEAERTGAFERPLKVAVTREERRVLDKLARGERISPKGQAAVDGLAKKQAGLLSRVFFGTAGAGAFSRLPLEQRRVLVLEAAGADIFAGKLRNPVTSSERAALDRRIAGKTLSEDDLKALDAMVFKQQRLLTSLLFARLASAGARCIIFQEPKGEGPFRIEPRSFSDRIMKYQSGLSALQPDRLPRYLAGAEHAGRLREGTQVRVRQAPASLLVPGTGQRVRLYPMWPNLVRTCSTPRSGISGRLIWAGSGSLGELKGKVMKDSIALVDFNCAYQWVGLADLGARAILMAEPEQIMRGEADNKYLSLPADIPRFWVKRQDVAALRALEGRKVRVDAQVVWERGQGRTIIGRIGGTQPDADPDPVVIHAHYDSVSVVPDIAPGAEQACGAAVMLELARVLKRYPLKKTTLLVLTSGHSQNMRGWVEFLHRHYVELEKDKDDPDRIKPAFVVDLDLTTRTRRLAVFYKAHRFNQGEGPTRRVYSTFGKSHTLAGAEAAKVLGYGKDFMVDAVNAVSGRTWDSYMPGRFALAQEVTLNAGLYGLAYVTPDDERVWMDTPQDVPGQMDFDSLARQARVLACVLPNQLNVGAAFSSSKVVNYWTSLKARVVEFDQRTSFLPNRTVSGAIIWGHHWPPNKTLKGVRGDWFIQAIGDREEGGATFELHGLPNSSWLATGWQAHTICEAYEMDPLSGDIRYAPDRGPQGSQQYRLETDMNEKVKKLMLVVFPCRPLLLFDLVDPLRYSPFYRMTTLDGETDSAPPAYGQSIPEPNWYSSYVEPLAVVFSAPDRPVKITYAVWLLGRRLALVNATDQEPEGVGYMAGESGRLNFTAMHAAEDMFRLNDFRMRRLKRFGVVNHFLEELHVKAGEQLGIAHAALKRLDYREAVSQARAAWGLSSRVYPEVENTAQDVVKSAMLFLALLIPFAFLSERLLFGFPTATKQVLGVLGIFLVMFAGLRMVHPAFQIALTPIMILLAFVVLALSSVVIVMVASRFFDFLREEREQMQGVHRADVSKMSVGLAAFALGVSNMRKRPLRTGLTCMTLVALMFAVLSLTSVVQAVKQRKFAIGKPCAYEGLLFRSTTWSPLGEPALRYLETEMEGLARPAPRAWFVSYQADRQSAIEIAYGDSHRVTAVAALGMTDREKDISGIGRAVVAGSWLKPGVSRACLLPVKLAATLFIGPEDVGKARVVMFGVPFTVCGLFDPKVVGKIRDLDDEEIAPVNFEATEKRRQQQNITSMYQTGRLPERYDHHDPGQTVIMPYDDLMRLGGKVASIAVPMSNPRQLESAIKHLLSRLGLLVYVGREGKTYAYSAIGDTASEGLGYLFVPVLIAGFIVFSTMLGAVQERTREISVFSSVGLAPDHVAILFLAEACVYAILGAVVGYLLGQSFAHLIVSGLVLEGLNVNYSSDAAVMATFIVMLVVLLSTIYPAILASRLARPSQVTGFSLPALVGDKVRLELPFSFNQRDAQAVCAFLAEFLEAHAEASAGEFSAGNIHLSRSGKNWVLNTRVWLAPYDFGVSQDMAFSMREGIGDESSADLVITRLSGDQASWRRVNGRFLKTVRKQFLIWRAIGETSRIDYQRRAAALERKGVTYASA